MSYRRKHIRPKLKKRKKIYQRPFFWIFLILLGAISILYIALFHSKFQVVKVEISGNEKTKSQDVETIVWNNIQKKILGIGGLSISSESIFIADSKKIARDILDKFPSIEEVQVEKKLPAAIILKIKERKPFAVFCHSSENCFFIDSNGVVFENLQSLPQNAAIVITKGSNNSKVFLGESVIDKNNMDSIQNVMQTLKNNFRIGIREVFVSSLLVFKTSENWQVYFDPNSDINSQITKMDILLKDEISPNARKNLQYIYLQYKDRAYYK